MTDPVEKTEELGVRVVTPPARRRAYRKTVGMKAEWRRARRTVFERDGFTCRWCGVRDDSGKSLDCHHTSYKEPIHVDTLVTLCEQCHGRFGNNPGEVPSAGFSRALDLRRFAIESGLADPRACLQNELFVHYLQRVVSWLERSERRMERVLGTPNALKSLLRPRSPAFDKLGLSFIFDRSASLDVDASLAALARQRVSSVGDIEVTARAFAAWWRRGRFRVRFGVDGEVESKDLGPLPRTAQLLRTLEELAAQAERAPRETPLKG